ncbi:nucleoside-binding protein [Alteribacillus persepolensis]|uniref:Nucleoside-binding protein n=1 Tax=Alteribacillus persepolensis TaxID=568899 RepID=A0A1G8H2X2_9BACI|nr:BMP family ABC transporter substrate-binding protein [Alteribacillus persepolensis]SDI00850.1 nucleoside-binding protein [Alteribacillus persepolensis]
MKKSKAVIWMLCLGFFLLTSCQAVLPATSSTDVKAALLLESTVDDKTWNQKGFEGLLSIQSELNMEVMYEENITSLGGVKTSLDALQDEGVELVFGHGKTFADMFEELSNDYENMHFVSLNGQARGENVTSIIFDGYAMGFFAGRLSQAMSDSNTVGVIAAQEWQPEVEGFMNGAQSADDASVRVMEESVGSWDDKETALQILNRMIEAGADVIYPAGNGYHLEVIEELKDKGLYAIGYIGDQSDLGKSTVLTSTVQHVGTVYRLAAEQYQNNELESGIIHVDFQDGAISMGTYSSVIPADVKGQLEKEITVYKETGDLPE